MVLRVLLSFSSSTTTSKFNETDSRLPKISRCHSIESHYMETNYNLLAMASFFFIFTISGYDRWEYIYAQLLVRVRIHPQVIMSASDPSLKHIQQRLVTFLQFVQRGLGSSALRKLCIAIFKCLALLLRFLRSRWQILCEKQWTSMISSSLSLTKQKNNCEYGSITDANGLHQVQVSGRLNHRCLYAYF